MEYTLEKQIGANKLVLETGKLAGQASGAVVVRYGEVMLLATAVMSKEPRPDIDFLPLTVEFEEKLYAAGKIPGSFFRREGRPTTEAILSARLVDRPLRPQFPKALHNDLQIVITTLSTDRQTPLDVLGIIGASAAVAISDIPFNGPVGATRVGYKDGEYIINPTFDQINDCELNVVVAGVRGAVGMVEAGANEVSESVVLEAIRKAQETNDQIIDMIEELDKAAGKPDTEISIPDDYNDLENKINTVLGDRLRQVIEHNFDRDDREEVIKGLKSETQVALSDEFEPRSISSIFGKVLKSETRSMILDKGIRPDGRALTDIRPITCEVGILPRTHGSGLFTRGETQVLSVVTLASTGMAQKLDTLGLEDSKRFLHHYNFPAYSVGETGRMFTGRREIGHGALAERAILAVIPDEDQFPYTIRVVSEVLSSNGSTSMGSVCGGILALMDAGVPVKKPVAGVAMGLIKGEDGRTAVLTDIQGMEDFLGDMDFKVAGTTDGITALQMDIKIQGLPYEILQQALEQARVGRLHILDKMVAVIDSPRNDLSPYAPKMVRLVIPVEKIGAVIGPGGRNIRKIIEETGATVDIDDKGVVMIGGVDDEKIQQARKRVENITRELEVGDVFTGKVARITNFGSFVELVPGKDGLLRSEEMASSDDPVTMGQEITVMIKEIDSMGRINLSRRPLFGEESPPRQPSNRPPRSQFGHDSRRGGPQRGSRDFGPRGERRSSSGGGGRPNYRSAPDR